MGDKLNFLLMGKTGDGKSATGNNLLKRKTIKTSSHSTSKTRKVVSGFAQLLCYILMVVDGPGLEDTYKSQAEDKEAAAKHMNIALGMCSEGVDAFLLVIKYGNRFTSENRIVLNALKRIFGDKYINHLIVIVTYGDQFQYDREDEQSDLDFHAWCKNEEGDLRQLYEDCKGRFVLFNNREKNAEKNQAQIQELVYLTLSLRRQCGRYTSQCFEDADRERRKLILEKKAPQLTREIQEKLGLLVADIDNLTEQSLPKDREQIRKGIKELKDEVEVKDQGFGVLENLRNLLDSVDRNLDNLTELHKLNIELEKTRKAKGIWGLIGSVACDISSSLVGLSRVGGVLGVAVGAGGAVGMAVGGLSKIVSHVYSNKETEMEQKVNRLQIQMKRNESITKTNEN